MNMMDRFFRVIKSNVNNVLSSLEDPEKVLEQAVSDMQSDLVKIRQSYAEVSATQKRMEKQKDQASATANDWYKRAQLALEKGDEALAREALKRRQAATETAESVASQMEVQAKALDKLYMSMTELEAKIVDAKRQKDTLIARARTAKTSVQVNDMLSSMTGSNSMEAFERMKAKVETFEAQAEVAGELAASTQGGGGVEDQFKLLEAGSKVDDELDALRRQLGSGSTSKSSSSTSKSSESTNPPIPNMSSEEKIALDAEYEKLKKDLGL